MEGIVIKSTGSWYNVAMDDGKIIKCRLKGKFRIKGIKTTNPVAVGDHVRFTLQEDEGNGIITEILPRRNHIIRKSIKLSKLSHIIAANIDLAFLVATIREPYTTTGFIDRFLVSAEAYHIPAAIIFNKIDIYTHEDQQRLEELTAIYRNAGYPVFAVSALTGENLDMVKEAMKDSVCLFSGNSGVGKSHIINSIEPGLKLKTGKISEYHSKGKHTTTYPEMHQLSFGGYIIDTPGIREFGLVEFRREEIAERFPEMRKYMHDCQFNNCTHIHEPNCAVKAAVERGDMPLSRYESYLRIVEDDYLDKGQWEWQ
ncbi:MAG: ribosome small subunit-dependent GTPase A [Bacteroidales bacterium]